MTYKRKRRSLNGLKKLRAFNDIKKLLINPPVLKAPTPDGLFRLESDTSREGVGGTLLQKQGDEWVVIGYHSKRLLKSAKNFGVTELELTGLLVNIHGFMQLLHNRYFEVLVDHKAIEYMIKSKTESPMTRLKTGSTGCFPTQIQLSRPIQRDDAHIETVCCI